MWNSPAVIQLGPQKLEFEFEHRFPGFLILLKDNTEQALDNPLFRESEITALDSGAESAVPAEHVVHYQKHKVWVENEQGRSAQRLGLDQVQVGRHHQVADELVVLDDADRSNGNIRRTPHEVEQTNAQLARKALVDDLQGWHAPANDALLGRQVVGANA